MKFQPLWLGLLLTLPFAVHAAVPATETKVDGQKVTFARYAKAFIGAGNITVEVAPYKSKDGEGALLLFKGVEHEWDGKIVNHQVTRKANGQGAEYSTTYKGQRWTTLTQTKADAGKEITQLYLPGTNEPIALASSDGAAAQTSPRQIFDLYAQSGAAK